MKNTELFDILGNIDDKFYDEVLGGDSERPMEISIKKPAFSIKNVLMPVAACLAVAAGIGVTAHFLSRTDFIDPNPADSNTLSDVALANPNITDADIEECKALLKDRYPDIDEDNFRRIFRVIDIDFDGCDEIIVDQGALFIFDKTADGMVETAQLDEFAKAYTSINNIHKYESNGERYWYYYDHKVYDLTSGELLCTDTLARLKFEDGEYSIDHTLGYGYSYEDRYNVEPKQWFFKSDWTNLSEPAEMPESNITPEEFKEKWSVYPELPEFYYYTTFEEEYPMFDLAKVPVINPYEQPEKLLPKAVLDVRDMGEYKLCLIGERIYQYPGSEDSEIISLGSLYIGLVKDGELIPSIDGFGCFISSACDGYSQFCVDTNRLDKYIRNIFTLEDGSSIIEIRYQRAGDDKFGVESLFYGVKNGAPIRLYSKDCGYDLGDLGELTVDGNSLIDNENAVKYEFYPDTFEGNPFEVPHFTKRDYLPEGDYPAYNGQAAPRVTLCEKTLAYYGGTVKLLALNAEPVIENGVERVKYSQLFLRYDESRQSGWVKPIYINGSPSGLITSRLDDYLETISFVNYENNLRELIAVYQSFDEGSAIREYAVFYGIGNGKGFTQKPSEYNGAIIPSGDPTYLGRDFTLSHNDWTIVLGGIAEGEKIVFDFENIMYDVIYPEQ